MNNLKDSAVVEKIGISGISGRFPSSNNVDEFWENLMAGKDMVTVKDGRWPSGLFDLPERKGILKCDIEAFDAEHFGLNPKMAAKMDSQLRLLLEVTEEAIWDAGYTPSDLAGSKTGVFVGFTSQDTFEFLRSSADSVTGYDVPATSGCMFANRISYTFDLHGPSIALDTFCSSSLSALNEAVSNILAGNCDAAIVAGVNLLINPLRSLQMLRLGVLSPDGACKSFSEDGNGYAQSEAVVAILIQKKSLARRCYAEILSCQANADGYKTDGVSFPSSEAQRQLMLQTYSKIGLNIEDVYYFEAHGTGTKAGDPQELNAIDQVYFTDLGRSKSNPLYIGSVKSNMGHAEPAASLCSVIKVLKSMQARVLPANLHFNHPNKSIKALSNGTLRVVTQELTPQLRSLEPLSDKIFCINASGIGGANVHVVLKAADEAFKNITTLPEYFLVPFQAFSVTTLENSLEQVSRQKLYLNPDFMSLIFQLNNVSGLDSNLFSRGFHVVTESSSQTLFQDFEEKASIGEKELWYVFSGMGTQWPGMAKDMMIFPEFRRSVEICARVMQPYNVDVENLVLQEDCDTDVFKNFLGLSFGIVGIALIDLMKSIDLVPSGMIGHSAGEWMCGYADGALSREETLLLLYYKDIYTEELKQHLDEKGAMAAVGVSWDQALKMCPPGLTVACNNGAKSVTFSGKEILMQKFTEALKSQGIFVSALETGGIAYHSKMLNPICSKLENKMGAIIKNPKRKSSRWLSTSQMEPLSENTIIDAAYFIHNFTSPVRFYNVLKLIPPNAVVVEVSAHSLFQRILKNTLPPRTPVFDLMKRFHSDNPAKFLETTGHLFLHRFQPNFQTLHGNFKPQRCLPSTTPSISPLIKWNHRTKFDTINFNHFLSSANNKEKEGKEIQLDLKDPHHAYLGGHKIDGKWILPATASLIFTWNEFVKHESTAAQQFPILLKNLKFHSIVLLPQEGSVSLVAQIFPISGFFQIYDRSNNMITVTGEIHRIDGNIDVEKEYSTVDEVFNSRFKEIGKNEILQENEVYTLLRLRGYEYTGPFKGIVSSNITGTQGELRWEENWTSFLDTMIQFSIIGNPSHDLKVPTAIKKIAILPSLFNKVNESGLVRVQKAEDLDLLYAPGVLISGLKFETITRRNVMKDEPLLETYGFVPYMNREFMFMEESQTLKMCADIVFENALIGWKSAGKENRNVYYWNNQRNEKEEEEEEEWSRDRFLGEKIIQQFERQPDHPNDCEVIEVSEVEDEYRGTKWEGEWEKPLIFVANVHPESSDFLEVPIQGEKLGARFILLRMRRQREDKIDQMIIEPFCQKIEGAIPSYSLTSLQHCRKSVFFLWKKVEALPAPCKIIHLPDSGTSEWIEELKCLISRSLLSNQTVQLVAEHTEKNRTGILGFINCLLKEGIRNVRCSLFIGGKAPPEQELLNASGSTLVMNVYNEAGVHGSFRHVKLPKLVLAPSQTSPNENFYHVDIGNTGDLSTLHWVRRSCLPAWTDASQVVDVHFCSLNFRDVMLATGKLSPSAIPNSEHLNGTLLGLEYSGVQRATGRRVMGILPCQSMANVVHAHSDFTWEIPSTWSLQQGASVPMAFATAYYALVVRGRISTGESVLIHSASGGVGQAAVRIALNFNCNIFVTVGTEKKKQFLHNLFENQIDQENILNSRDVSFASRVLLKTGGKGVNVVLNSLSGEKLEASLTCLAEGGRFLEIGKVDLSQNSKLGMAIFLKNISFHGILLDALFQDTEKYRQVRENLRDLVEKGITAGTVRPLEHLKVFRNNEVEPAFRFMAGGKHIGKVLLRVLGEESGDRSGNYKYPEAQEQLLFFDSEEWKDKVFLMIGGLGGFGLQVADFLVTRGAQKLLLVSRKGVTTGYQSYLIRQWESKGVHVIVAQDDLSQLESATLFFQRCQREIGSVGAIFNLAMVLKDSLVENISQEDFQKVLKPKVDISRNVDLISRQNTELRRSLRYFILFSSVSSGRGNAGQGSYAYANSWMERLCESRKKDGLPGLCIQWGAVGDVGVVASNLISNNLINNDTKVGGTLPQRIQSCIQTLEEFLLIDSSCQAMSSVLSSIIVARQNDHKKSREKESHNDETLESRIIRVIGISGSDVDKKVNFTLAQCGVDSLMAVEIQQILETFGGFQITSQDVKILTWAKIREISSQRINK